MERNAIEAPRPCFALEQTRDNPLCPNCPYRRDCADLMGLIVNGLYVDRVDVDRVSFNFMPPLLAKRLHGQDPDAHSIENVYGFCYEWVFDMRPRGSVGKFKDAILRRVKEAETSIKLFFLANMLSWRESHGETAFYPQAMTGETAVKAVRAYAAACYTRFGAFDTFALDRLTGSDMAKKDFETHLLNSEIEAGSWIVNYKLFHSGELAKNLYKERELALNPYWLAIETTYYDLILLPHIESLNPDCVPLVRKHRWNASQVLAMLKKHPLRAIGLFSARERIMPQAIRRVLSELRLEPGFFQIENLPQTEPLKFWSRLGSAIQQYECLKFVDKIPSVFDGHFAHV